MEHGESTLVAFRQIETDIRHALQQTEADITGGAGLKAVQTVRKKLELTRKWLQDYELEEDTKKQIRSLLQSIENLELLRSYIVEASQYNLFGAVDVAQLSAKIDQLTERLR
jgi:hypothetical protein